MSSVMSYKNHSYSSSDSIKSHPVSCRGAAFHFPAKTDEINSKFFANHPRSEKLSDIIDSMTVDCVSKDITTDFVNHGNVFSNGSHGLKYTSAKNLSGSKSCENLPYQEFSSHDITDNDLTKNPESKLFSEKEVLNLMKYERNRLKSFENKWPKAYIKPADLAAVGLFYLQVADKVQCAFCRGIITDWNVGDIPLKEHLKYFPFCPFMMNQDVGNVPITGTNGTQKWQIENSHPECSLRPHARRNAESDVLSESQTLASNEHRLATFHNWPVSAPVGKELLAESGFYYTGISDIVRCFYCGGTLNSWEEGDNPWEEHEKHFPTCPFVERKKRSNFIANCTASEKKSVVAEAVACSSACSEEKQCESNGELVMAASTSGSLPNTNLCKICMDKERGVLFLPCGHLVSCVECALHISRCPVCRTDIKSTVRAYIS